MGHSSQWSPGRAHNPAHAHGAVAGMNIPVFPGTAISCGGLRQYASRARRRASGAGQSAVPRETAPRDGAVQDWSAGRAKCPATTVAAPRADPPWQGSTDRLFGGPCTGRRSRLEDDNAVCEWLGEEINGVDDAFAIACYEGAFGSQRRFRDRRRPRDDWTQAASEIPLHRSLGCVEPHALPATPDPGPDRRPRRPRGWGR